MTFFGAVSNLLKIRESACPRQKKRQSGLAHSCNNYCNALIINKKIKAERQNRRSGIVLQTRSQRRTWGGAFEKVFMSYLCPPRLYPFVNRGCIADLPCIGLMVELEIETSQSGHIRTLRPTLPILSCVLHDASCAAFSPC